LAACPQTKSQPNHLYLHHTQQEVDAHKRLVLVDWLIEVVDEFLLSQESLYLAISLLDRFLSLHAVPRCQLQLLGVTCLWVASKYEEVLPPALQVRSKGRYAAAKAGVAAAGAEDGAGSSSNAAAAVCRELASVVLQHSRNISGKATAAAAQKKCGSGLPH
jgi:hypothetical protein